MGLSISVLIKYSLQREKNRVNIKHLIIRKSHIEDIPQIQYLIKCLASYEKRPQDMTGTEKQLRYWLFERKIATVLIAEYEKEVVGYALYYPIFGSFSAVGKIHLEDIFIQPNFRGYGIGRIFLAKIAEIVLADGYIEMEWSCLDWNKSSIEFYERLGAKQETGRKYFKFTQSELKSIATQMEGYK